MNSSGNPVQGVQNPHPAAEPTKSLSFTRPWPLGIIFLVESSSSEEHSYEQRPNMITILGLNQVGLRLPANEPDPRQRVAPISDGHE